MDTQTFIDTLGTLTALPAEIREHAHALAGELTDTQRNDLMDELSEGNASLQEFANRIAAVTKGFEELLDRTERAMQGLTRKEQEEEEHTRDMQSIEEQLSNPPPKQ